MPTLAQLAAHLIDGDSISSLRSHALVYDAHAPNTETVDDVVVVESRQQCIYIPSCYY